MAFNPNRKPWMDRVLRAGMIAIERGDTVIGLEDWQCAAEESRRKLSSDAGRLKDVSVSDDVVRAVADIMSRPSPPQRGFERTRAVRPSSKSD
ncbi:hypothetical protein [Pseudoxanthomonas sp. J35]|uniref:hypothetical protein n=1 Tax=Pseudoxanthomonas sp. J35 TaxID=935852 RepID=UPI0012EC1424|nr:hypothetical protein [Pseudoxanthomonas sp. J35]